MNNSGFYLVTELDYEEGCITEPSSQYLWRTLYDFRISVYMLKNIKWYEIFTGLSHSLFSTTADEKLLIHCT